MTLMLQHFAILRFAIVFASLVAVASCFTVRGVPKTVVSRYGFCRTDGTARGNNLLAMGMFDEFFKGLDDFIDDAMDRKLAGGSTFYGERKSSFSGSPKSYRATATTEAAKREQARGTNTKQIDPLRMLRGGRISGEQLREIIYAQWGERFPVLIKRRRDALGEQRLYMVVQWKRLGKKNLNLSPEAYVSESNAVAELLTEWGVANEVRNAIVSSTARPKTATQQFPGLFIPLDVDRSVIETW